MAIAAYHKLSQTQTSPSLRWVKAKDRLPADPHKVVCIRGDGGGEYFYMAADTQMILQEMKLADNEHVPYEIEWLESCPSESPSPAPTVEGNSETIKQITEYRDEAVKKVNRYKHADTDDEFSELNYYNGQKVALDQVLSWLQKSKTPNP